VFPKIVVPEIINSNKVFFINYPFWGTLIFGNTQMVFCSHDFGCPFSLGCPGSEVLHSSEASRRDTSDPSEDEGPRKIQDCHLDLPKGAKWF